MADGDESKAADDEEARRRALRPRTTLDLAATDLSPPQGTPPPPDAAANDGHEPPPPHHSQWPGHIAAAVVGAVLAVAAIYALARSGNLPQAADDDRAQAIAALQGQVATLDKRLAAPQAATSDATARQGIQALRGTVSDLSGRIDALGGDLKATREALATKAPAEALTKLSQALGAARADGTADAGLAKRLDAADTAIAGKASTADLAGLAQRVAAVQAALKTLDTGNPGRAAAEARAAATLASVAAIEGALARGAPFQNYLADVQRLTGADLSPLQRYAEEGAPRLDALASRLAADLAAAPGAPPPPNAGLIERLYTSLRNLVRITPATPGREPTGTSATAQRQRVIARLDRGDYRGAIEAWNGLDSAARQATGDAEAALSARLDADRRLSDIGGRALSALAGAADAAR